MSSRKLLFAFWIFSIFCISVNTEENQTLSQAHSFDFGRKHYPHIIYHTEGATVILKNFIKLVPPVPFRAGELVSGVKNFLDSFRADITFQVKSTKNNLSYGFAVWYLNALKTVQDRKGNLFGIKGDYSGLGIFIYRDLEGNWIIHGNFNRGMDEYRITSENINKDNACTILGDVENVVRSIR